jgi:SOS response regulatory protein OraA/RecX
MSDAYEDGIRLLSRRRLTRHEVEESLRAKGHCDKDVAAVVSRLAGISAIDDRALAQHWVETQAAARGRGRERTIAELAARGVDTGVAADAWSEAIEGGTIDERVMLARAVRRRLGGAPGRARSGRLARVYNALLHEGFEREQIEAALGPYGFEGIDS